MTPILHPDIGPIKLGRTRPDPAAPRLRAAKYLRHATLPKAPDHLAASPLAQPCMDRLLLNDRLSLCTCVTTAKCSAQVNGFAGVPLLYADAQVKALYEGSCGYIDGRPDTDNGGNEDQVIDYVTRNGIERGLHHWAGKLSVNGSNPEEVRHIVGLTKNLFLGVELADPWLQIENGATLTRAGGPNPNNGHAIPAGGRRGLYTPAGLVLTMWGGIEVVMPWDLVAEFTEASDGGELHTMISKDMLVKGTQHDADGRFWQAIADDFRAAGGTLAA